MQKILTMLLAALLMAACGTQASPDAVSGNATAAVNTQAAESNPNATSELSGTENFPTDEVGIPDGDVAVTPTPQGTPLGTTLPEEASSEDGTLTVQYPEGWFADSQSGNTIVISNEESLADSTTMQTAAAGQAIMTIMSIPREVFEETNAGLNDMARTIADTLSASYDASGATFGDPAEGEINGYPSVTLTGTVTTENTPSDVHIILIDREGDDVILQLVMVTANGESVDFEGTAQEIAGSVVVEGGTAEADAGDGVAGGTAEVSADSIEEGLQVTVTATRDAGDGTPDAGTPGYQGTNATQQATP